MVTPTIVDRAASGSSSIYSSDNSLHIINYVTQALSLTFLTVFFSLRMYAGLKVLGRFTVEDGLYSGAYLCGVGYSIVLLFMGYHGGGVHAAHVPADQVMPFRKTVYVSTILNTPAVLLTKLSLLWIMKRVFSIHPTAVRLIHGFLVLLLAYYIPNIILKIFICIPVAKNWDTTIVEGKCLPQEKLVLGDAIVSIITDLVIMVFPFPLILRLQMPVRHKIKGIALLGAGGLAVAASIVRLEVFVRFGILPDYTYNILRMNLFGSAEMGIGFICATMPSLSKIRASLKRDSGVESGRNTLSSLAMSKLRNRIRGDRNNADRHLTENWETGSDTNILDSQSTAISVQSKSSTLPVSDRAV